MMLWSLLHIVDLGMGRFPLALVANWKLHIRGLDFIEDGNTVLVAMVTKGHKVRVWDYESLY